MGIVDLGRYKDAVDVIQKILVGIGLAVVGTYVAFAKDEYEKDKFCYSTKVSLLGEAGGKFDQSGVSARINLMHSLCPGRIEEFTQLLMLAAQTGRAATANATAGEIREPGRTPTRPSASAPPSAGAGDGAIGGPVAASGVAPLEGWVAVGFADPKVYSDTNFDLASKTKAGEATPLTGQVATGAILKARWQVNVRRGAADWRDPVGLLDIGQCGRVQEVTKLKAGQREQYWAELEKTDCDAALTP